MNTADIDTTNMCLHLRHKLMDADGIYHPIWQTIQDDPELSNDELQRDDRQLPLR